MKKNFKSIQHELATWLRAEKNVPQPFDTIEVRRLGVYKRLIHNNIQQFLNAGFPVLREVLSNEQWQYLSHSFIVGHHAQSPLFSDIGAEFVDFVASLDESEQHQQNLPPWLFELAHYERLEVDVLHATFDDRLQSIETLSESTPLHLNSTAKIAIYNFPVATISATSQPDECVSEPCCILVYRKPGWEKVDFMQVNRITADVLTQLQASPLTFSQLFEESQVQFPEQNPEALAQGLLQFIQDFSERFVLFTRP